MKTKLLYLCLLVVILGVSFYLYKNQTKDQIGVHQKCSNEYGTDDAGSAEYLADFDKWTNNFYDTHPGATLSDWSKARYQFWIDNDCTAQIEGYEEVNAGTADPATLKVIDDTKDIIRGHL